MTKIVVDTNILFSSLLNVNSRIAQILIRGGSFYEFYALNYIKNEIFEHKLKIKELGKLSKKNFNQIYRLVSKHITILNHSVVPFSIYKKAEDICTSIDAYDTAFVAFALYTNGKLWTGDKKLISGLRDKGFEYVITTEELYSNFLNRLNL